MMTRELEISILAAPLAAMDRRALSQAWYSALRLAQPRCLAPPPRCAGETGERAPVVQLGVCRPDSIGNAGAGNSRVRTGRSAARRRADQEALLRVPGSRTSLARRIAHTFAGVRPSPKRATFSLGRGNARVHIILQTNGASAILLALCRPELRAVVCDALAQTRATLAARGICLDVRTAKATNVL
jgi:hypothetical protein